MLTFKVHTSGIADLQARFAQACTEAEHALANEVAKDTTPFVPALTNSLTARTQVDGNKIIYPGPYARYPYYGKVMVDSVTGKGPMHFIGKDGNEVIRFRKGATLVATDRNLDIQQTVHPQAQSHWFEASKKQNLDKWTRFAERAVKNGL